MSLMYQIYEGQLHLTFPFMSHHASNTIIRNTRFSYSTMNKSLIGHINAYIIMVFKYFYANAIYIYTKSQFMRQSHKYDDSIHDTLGYNSSL